MRQGRRNSEDAHRYLSQLTGCSLFFRVALLLIARLARSVLFTLTRDRLLTAAAIALELRLKLAQFLYVTLLLVLVHGLVLLGLGERVAPGPCLFVLLGLLLELGPLCNVGVYAWIRLHNQLVEFAKGILRQEFDVQLKLAVVILLVSKKEPVSLHINFPTWYRA